MSCPPAFGAIVVLMAALVSSGPFLQGQALSAQPPVPDSDLKELAATLRTMLVQALPPVLYEGNSNWGHTRTYPRRRLGVRVRNESSVRNDGTWRKIKLTTRNPAQSLALDLRDWKYPDADHLTFTASLAFDAGVEFQQQNWERGLRLYSGSLRARMRLHLDLKCEFLLRLEMGAGLFPDFVFRLRVIQSNLKYDKLVVEHLAGIGGTGAKVLGEALQSHIRQWHPHLERDLLARANAAIIRAADTREVRLGLSSLMKVKK